MRNWIPIKHDYLIDNFDSLLASLNDADFSNPDDGILFESISALEEVAKGLLSDYFSHKSGILNPIDDIFYRNVRIVLASIYSSLKIKRNVTGMLVDLLDSLVVNNSYTDEESLAKIKAVAACMAEGAVMETLPYNLRDLAPDRFDFPLFRQQLLGFAFSNDDDRPGIYESGGSCVFDGGEIKIYPAGIRQPADFKFRTVVEASLDVRVMSDSKKKLNDLDFKDQELFLNHFRQSFSQGAPTVSKKLKTYSEGQEFFVKVADIDYSRGLVKCSTIDPAYETLELNLDLLKFLNLNKEVAITLTEFLKHLKPGQTLKVMLDEKNGRKIFNINATIKEGFFTNVDNFNDSYAAIFLTDYPGGTRWLTEMGHTVNIQDNDWDTEIEQAAAIDCGLAIEVCGIGVKTDKKGNAVMNAMRTGQLFEDEPQKFRF